MVASFCVMTASAGFSHAVDKVSAVHAFPGFLVYTKTFLAMVDDINKRGEGVVEISVRGGPEAIAMFEQPNAVRDGVVDMVHTPGSFYGASVPEIDKILKQIEIIGILHLLIKIINAGPFWAVT